MIPSGDLPPFPEVRREKASDLRIVSDTEWDDYMSEIPQKGISSDGTTKFFKPALDKKQLLREVDMHLRIHQAVLQDTLKISNLHSIVVSTNTKMTIGLLLDLIPSTGDSLYSHQNSALASEHHARWKQQITDTVEQLHAHDLVWGDVHPGNIVIDTSFNAWVVDFGGGSIVEFVPRKKAGMKEGDWQGVGKVFDEWIFESDD
jgi:serine/threonine protein kinase